MRFHPNGRFDREATAPAQSVATARTALSKGLNVIAPHDAHATYDVPEVPGVSDRISAALVPRVAEWESGDQAQIVARAVDLAFTSPNHRH